MFIIAISGNSQNNEVIKFIEDNLPINHISTTENALGVHTVASISDIYQLCEFIAMGEDRRVRDSYRTDRRALYRDMDRRDREDDRYRYDRGRRGHRGPFHLRESDISDLFELLSPMLRESTILAITEEGSYSLDEGESVATIFDTAMKVYSDAIRNIGVLSLSRHRFKPIV